MGSASSVRPVSCLCVCHSNTLGVPSEGEMYRVSQKCGNLFVSGENWLWFGLRLKSNHTALMYLAFFSESCEVCS